MTKACVMTDRDTVAAMKAQGLKFVLVDADLAGQIEENVGLFTEAEVQGRELLARLDALMEVRAALPVHDHGEWLATQLDERIAALEREATPGGKESK